MPATPLTLSYAAPQPTPHRTAALWLLVAGLLWLPPVTLELLIGHTDFLIFAGLPLVYLSTALPVCRRSAPAVTFALIAIALNIFLFLFFLTVIVTGIFRSPTGDPFIYILLLLFLAAIIALTVLFHLLLSCLGPDPSPVAAGPTSNPPPETAPGYTPLTPE